MSGFWFVFVLLIWVMCILAFLISKKAKMSWIDIVSCVCLIMNVWFFTDGIYFRGLPLGDEVEVGQLDPDSIYKTLQALNVSLLCIFVLLGREIVSKK